jgi:imidazolonepropionase-like amidohydrolase
MDAGAMVVFENCNVFDGVSGALRENACVVVEGDRIVEVAETTPRSTPARRIDCGHRVLMPGLIDAHVHAYSPSFSFYENDRLPPSLLAVHGARALEGMLERGFTSVRDAGGGDVGLARAIERGLIKGPRFFYSGKAISQTGGHGDMRPGELTEPCGCSHYSGSISRVADGADAVRQAVRDELRHGATQIKLFVSGGVSSPNDPIWMNQFTDDEIRAAVEEAATRRAYVMAHCHTDEAARRCVELGVRTIEHGTEIKPETAALMAKRNVYVVPTLSVINMLARHAKVLKISPATLHKAAGLYEQMTASIRVCAEAGVKIGLGTDLLGQEFQHLQGGELDLRGAVQSPIDVLRSATSVNAEILQRAGELGTIAPGAHADILVLNRNPLEDLSVFRDPVANIPIVVKAGVFVRCAL